MRKIKLILVPILILLLDFALVIVSFLLGYLFRYGTDIPQNSFKPFKESFLVLALIYVLAFAFAGLFRRRFNSHWQLIKKVSYGIGLGTLFAFMFMYAFRIKWSPFPSSLFLLAVPTGIILVSAANMLSGL